MRRNLTKLVALGLVTALPFQAAAQQVGSDDFTFEDGFLVTASDVTTCPYRLVRAATVSVTEDYGAGTPRKAYSKLRDRGKQMAADAVILVVKGGRHMSAWAFSRRDYTGRAIRYVDRRCASHGGEPVTIQEASTR